MFNLPIPLAVGGTCLLASAVLSCGRTQSPSPPEVSPSIRVFPSVVALPPISAVAPLKAVDSAQLPAEVAVDPQLWQRPNGQPGDKAELLAAVAYSLQYLQTPKAIEAYENYPVAGISRDRVIRSLQRFQQLVQTTSSPAALQAEVKREFEFYQSVGNDGQGQVLFTGYYEPVFAASATPTATHRYPLYKRPTDFETWKPEHPTRKALEGKDGLQAAQGRLKNLELVWLSDRLSAFLIQVQGSARLQLTDGRVMTVGFAGKTDRSYTSIGKELIKDGKIREEDISLDAIRQYFQEHPGDLDVYLPRNESFVFFQDTGGAPAIGNLDVPVTAERSIATDNALMPPGALALIQTQLPYFDSANQLTTQAVSRYVLDQDTGGAIKGPGRVDLFVGTGAQAEARAGEIKATGTLYYLLLKADN